MKILKIPFCQHTGLLEDETGRTYSEVICNGQPYILIVTITGTSVESELHKNSIVSLDCDGPEQLICSFSGTIPDSPNKEITPTECGNWKITFNKMEGSFAITVTLTLTVIQLITRLFVKTIYWKELLLGVIFIWVERL